MRIGANAAPNTGLRGERDRFVALAFAWADILFELDSGGVIVYAAGPLEPLVNASAPELCGRPLLSLVSPADRAPLQALLSGARRNERFTDSAIRLYGSRGPSAPFTLSGYRLADLNGHYFVLLRMAASEPRSKGFGRRSRGDGSGLLDKSSFIDTVTQFLAEGRGINGESCSLIMLPDYARLRDRLPEAAEQELRDAVGEQLRAASIDGDSATRLDDERYALVHDHSVDLNRLTNEIADLTREADPLKSGLGVASATVRLDSAAMTEEQRQQGVVYTVSRFESASSGDDLQRLSTSLSQMAHDAAAAVDDFNALIAEESFDIIVRPVLRAGKGGIAHLEALAQLPSRFAGQSLSDRLALAEASGAIIRFDQLMLRKSAQWMQAAGRSGTPPVAVNVSAKSIASMAFLARLELMVRDHPELRGRLILDVSLSPGAVDLGATDGVIQKVREKGIQVGLADFCSGATGFASLARLNVDMVKFAASALREAGSGGRARAYLRAITSLCRELGMAPAAQGIEDMAALHLARECGFEFVGGSLFGPPSPNAQAITAQVPDHLFPSQGWRSRWRLWGRRS